jgi:hypothetical protein
MTRERKRNPAVLFNGDLSVSCPVNNQLDRRDSGLACEAFCGAVLLFSPVDKQWIRPGTAAALTQTAPTPRPFVLD